MFLYFIDLLRSPPPPPPTESPSLLATAMSECGRVRTWGKSNMSRVVLHRSARVVRSRLHPPARSRSHVVLRPCHPLTHHPTDHPLAGRPAHSATSHAAACVYLRSLAYNL